MILYVINFQDFSPLSHNHPCLISLFSSFCIYLYNLNDQVPSEVRIRVRIVLMTTRVGQQLRNTSVSITRSLTLLSRLRIDNITVLIPPALISHRILRVILQIVNFDIKRGKSIRKLHV